MSRRARIDPETARLVEERLQWLLREHGPQPANGRSSAEATDAPVRDRASVGARPTKAAQPRNRRRPPAAPTEAGTVDRRPRRGKPSSALEENASELAAESELIEQLDRQARADRATSATASPARRGDRPLRDHLSDDPPSDDRRSRETASASRDRPPRESGRLVEDGPVAALLTAVATFRRPQLVIVGVIVALGILLAGWAVLRARPVAVAVTPPPATASAADPRAGASTSSGAKEPSPTPTAPSVVVHVLGAVKKPGLVTLTAGSRVQDAIDAAGGLTRKADPGELNLAQQVADGQQIVVGTKGKPSGEVRSGSASSGGSSSSGSGGGSAGGSGQPVNLNTASQAELEELPGVGPVMAGKILAWRTEHGRFSRVEELQEIDGVGPKTYAKLAPLCQV